MSKLYSYFSAKIQKYPRNEGRIQMQKIYVFDFHTENIKIVPVLLARKFKDKKIKVKDLSGTMISISILVAILKKETWISKMLSSPTIRLMSSMRRWSNMKK